MWRGGEEGGRESACGGGQECVRERGGRRECARGRGGVGRLCEGREV